MLDQADKLAIRVAGANSVYTTATSFRRSRSGCDGRHTGGLRSDFTTFKICGLSSLCSGLGNTASHFICLRRFLWEVERGLFHMSRLCEELARKSAVAVSTFKIDPYEGRGCVGKVCLLPPEERHIDMMDC